MLKYISIKYFSFIFFTLIYISVVHSKTILLDPGHGGKELGAKVKDGKHTLFEKDISLDISRKVYNLLKKKHRVFLTRSFDKTISLEERADLADTVNADIFVSIHANSSTSPKARGFETYYLDNHKDAAVSKVERIENISSSGKEMIVQKILIDLVIERTSKDSKRLSNMIHKNVAKEMKRKFKIRDRGVRPGLFFVLALSKRPAALIEIGFMSNKSDREYMKTEAFKNSYAVAIANGIEEYFKSQK